MAGRRWLLLWALAIVNATAACTPHPVGPARTASSYEAKARTTAEAAASTVQTVRLAALGAADDRLFGPYFAELVSQQEDTLGGVIGTFDSIQPPDAASDDLRDELGRLLDAASDDVVEVRIAARRNAPDDLSGAAERLARDGDALDAFLEDHAA